MPTFRMFNNAGDRCVNNPPSGTYFRPWQRFDKEDNNNSGFSTSDLDMRRKAETLQYKKNASNMSTKQTIANLVRSNTTSGKRSQFATQPLFNSNTGINSNVDNLTRSGNRLIIPTCFNINSGLTSESGVPGKLMTLTLNRNVPLTRYVPVRRTYIGAEGSKFPFVGGDEV